MHAEPAAPGPGDRPRAARRRCPTACASRRSSAPAACTPPACSTPDGELLLVREDVGRHNAMDKVVGRALLDGRCRCTGAILCVSGRLSFELVQKAAVAGAPILVGVGAPTLAGGQPRRRPRHDARRLRPPRQGQRLHGRRARPGRVAGPCRAPPARRSDGAARAAASRGPRRVGRGLRGPRLLPVVRVPVDGALGRVAPSRCARCAPRPPSRRPRWTASRSRRGRRARRARPPSSSTLAFDVVDTGDPMPPGATPWSRASAWRPRRRRARDGRRRARETRARGRRGRRRRRARVAPGRRLGPVRPRARSCRRARRARGAPRADRRRSCRRATSCARPRRSCAVGELADTNSIMLDAQAREAGCATGAGRSCPTTPAASRRRSGAPRRGRPRARRRRHQRRPPRPRARRAAPLRRIVVRGVAMRPGHPAVLAVVDGTPVMGCPGYPVSAALAFERARPPAARRRWRRGAPPTPRASRRASGRCRLEGRRLRAPARGGRHRRRPPRRRAAAPRGERAERAGARRRPRDRRRRTRTRCRPARRWSVDVRRASGAERRAAARGRARPRARARCCSRAREAPRRDILRDGARETRSRWSPTGGCHAAVGRRDRRPRGRRRLVARRGRRARRRARRRPRQPAGRSGSRTTSRAPRARDRRPRRRAPAPGSPPACAPTPPRSPQSPAGMPTSRVAGVPAARAAGLDVVPVARAADRHRARPRGRAAATRPSPRCAPRSRPGARRRAAPPRATTAASGHRPRGVGAPAAQFARRSMRIRSQARRCTAHDPP